MKHELNFAGSIAGEFQFLRSSSEVNLPNSLQISSISIIFRNSNMHNTKRLCNNSFAVAKMSLQPPKAKKRRILKNESPDSSKSRNLNCAVA
jgi:hypothetical protein